MNDQPVVPSQTVRVVITGILKATGNPIVQEHDFPVPVGAKDYTELLTMLWKVLSSIGGLVEKVSPTQQRFHPLDVFESLDAKVNNVVGLSGVTLK